MKLAKKLAKKPVLITSVLLAALVTSPLALSGDRYNEGMKTGKGMEGSHNGQMMNMGAMQDRMRNMFEMMNEMRFSSFYSRHIASS